MKSFSTVENCLILFNFRFFDCLFPSCVLFNYSKNNVVIKDKNPPSKKNGPNGMYFVRCIYAQIAPVIHAMINASESPYTPSHSPPTPISFISPIPIGGYFNSLFLFSAFSNKKPIVAVVVYPKIPPSTALVISIGYGKNTTKHSPININGNKYLSGMIRCRKSVIEICIAQYVAKSAKIMKNM